MNNQVKIDKNILSVSIGSLIESQHKPQKTATLVVQTVTEKMKRPETLSGRTYKIKTPLSDSALYLTINDVVLNAGTENEVRRPFEIFINSKEMENYQWVVAVTRLISAIFRKGGDVTFILEELKSIFDPNGGYMTSRGRIPSLVAEIGMTIEEHFKYLGLIESELPPEVAKFIEAKKAAHIAKGGSLDNAGICKKCYARAVIVMDKCPTCLTCGDSSCS